MGNLTEMPLVGSAATTENIDPGEVGRDFTHLLAKFDGITILKMSELAESELVHLHSIRTDASQPVQP